MHVYYERWRDAALAYMQGERAKSERTGIRVCVLGGTGHGDKARQLAFCGGVREKYPDAFIFFLGMPFAAASGMVDYDMAHCAKTFGAVDAYYFMQGVEREPLIQDVLAHFDVVFDTIPYAVGTFWQLGQSGPEQPPGHECNVANAERQVLAGQRLAPFRWLYDGYPELDWRLNARSFNVWDIMARTSGIDVTPWDLSYATPLECAPWPDAAELTTCLNEDGELDGAIGRTTLMNSAGSDDPKHLDLGYVGDYVVVHNSAGRGGQTKTVPACVFKAIVAFLEIEGIRCVQIGRKGEQKLADSVIDRRGLRLPLVNQILERSDCLGLIGIDSLPPFMAMGMGKQAMVLFGSTARTAHGLPNELALVRLDEKTMRPPCPLGLCFRMPGYGPRCLLGKEMNEDLTHCLNTLPPEDAGRAAVEFTTHQRTLRDEHPVPEEVGV